MSDQARVKAATKTDACQNGHVWTSDDCEWRDGEWDWRCDCGKFGRDFPPDAVEAYFATDASVEAADPLRALVAKWKNEAAVKDSFHATMGIGWKACAADLEALLAAPVASAEEETP